MNPYGHEDRKPNSLLPFEVWWYGTLVLSLNVQTLPRYNACLGPYPYPGLEALMVI